MVKSCHILYFSHVPWAWIKQRPHFIFERLSEVYDSKYIGAMNYKKKNAQGSRLENLSIRHFLRVPNRLRATSKIVRFIDFLICFMQFQWLILFYRPKLIWVTSPEVSRYLTNTQLKRCVFDYMDLYDELQPTNILRRETRQEINRLLGLAKIIFASSKKLYHDAIERNPNVFIINNAVSDEFINRLIISGCDHKINTSSKKIVYVGTLSHWFDLELIKKTALSLGQDFQIDLYGPSEIDLSRLPQNITYHGIIPHDDVYEVILGADICIMPFKVNKLIEAVDPVKIYEYISLGKPIICPKYDELIKFERYLQLYANESEFLVAVRNIVDDAAYGKTFRTNLGFAQENCWSARICEMLDVIQSVGQDY